MGEFKKVDFVNISHLKEWCDLIHGVISDFPPSCFGYFDECIECDVIKYDSRARIGLTKLILEG